MFKITADAFYVRTEDGVWLRNNSGSFSVRGQGSYELVHTLFTALEDGHDAEEILQPLPDGAKRAVSQLIDKLQAGAFIRKVEHPQEEVPEWMAERYRQHLAYLDHHADRPVARFLRARSTSVACVGEGAALRAVVGALSEFGFADVLVAGAAADLAELSGLMEAGWRTLALQEAGLNAAVRHPEVARAAQVLLAVDRDDVAEVADAQESLTAGGQSVGVLGRCGEFVVSVSDWCWECVSGCFSAPVTGQPTGLAPAAAPATIAALHLVQNAFARAAEVELAGGDTVTSVEPLAPVVRSHARRRHPGCRRHEFGAPREVGDLESLGGELVRPDVPTSHDPEDLVAINDRIVTATASWVDRVTGPFLTLGEEEERQLPLAASTCRVSDGSVTRDVVCRTISARESRNQVALLALEWLAGRYEEASPALERPARQCGEASPTSEWSGGGRGKAFFGAGWSRAEAVYRALLAASEALAGDARVWDPATEALAGDAGVWKPAAEALAGDAGVWKPAAEPAEGTVRRFLADTLRDGGRPWTATAVERLPTGLSSACVRAGEATVRGLGLDEEHAVDNALLRAVAREAGHLAPPVATWSDAVATIAKQADLGGLRVLDAGALLPFIDDQAHLIAVVPVEEAG
ncbi:hypothetical protein ABZ897_24460 [Nonomuraea sp. NPDC046802]|uniref:hypothetical protein n=1 Tax=Nonomuraea sp. NPDC046802 TaxID=3154919 RepID=UPI0033D8CC01